MAYNLTAIDDSNTLLEVFVGLNNSLSGSLIGILLFGLMILLIIGFKRYDTPTGLIAAGTIVTLVSIPIIGAGLMNYGYITAPILVLLAGLVMKGLGKN